MRKIFRNNDEYENNINKYTKRDGILAIILFEIFTLAYSLLGILYVKFEFIKNKWIVVPLVGVLFIIMHFPYRMIASGITIQDLTINNIGWIIDLFITHIILSIIYMKTNSIYGSIIPHWMSNLAYNIVKR